MENALLGLKAVCVSKITILTCFKLNRVYTLSLSFLLIVNLLYILISKNQQIFM